MIDDAKDNPEKWSSLIQEIMSINDPTMINEISKAAIQRRIKELMNEKPTLRSSNAEHTIEKIRKYKHFQKN